MRNRTFAVFLVPALLVNQTFAQAHPELEALDGRIKQHFEKAPEWKYQRVEPLSNSKDVLVQFWSGQNSKRQGFRSSTSLGGGSSRGFRIAQKIQFE